MFRSQRYEIARIVHVETFGASIVPLGTILATKGLPKVSPQDDHFAQSTSSVGRKSNAIFALPCHGSTSFVGRKSNAIFALPGHGSTSSVGRKSAVHRVHDGSFDAAVVSLVSAACVDAAIYFVFVVTQSSFVPADYVPADYVSAGHVLVSADRDRIC
ncbi:hypothetical protein Tco_1109282 [Tanacetum coccineum]